MLGKKDLVLQKLDELLPEGAITEDPTYGSGIAFSAQVPVSGILDAAAACDRSGFTLESMTGLDFEDTAELVYHLNAYEPKSRFALRVIIPHGGAVPSLVSIYAAANWMEREVREFFGIEFDGHPDPRNLLLPEDDHTCPLRKTFGKVSAYRKREDVYA